MPEGLPSWLTAIIGSGTVGGMLSFVLYMVFTRTIPAQLKQNEDQRKDAIGAITTQRETFFRELGVEREESKAARTEFLAALARIEANFRADIEKERSELRMAVDRIIESLEAQTVVLSKIAGNHAKPPT